MKILLEKSPLNADYMDISKELARITELNRMKHAKEEVLVEESEGDYAVEELGEEIFEEGAEV